MPEGDRWRDEEVEGGQDGSLADDEDNDEEEEDSLHWMPVKAALEVTPAVTVLLHQPSREELPQDGGHFEKQGAEKGSNTEEPGTQTDPQAMYCPPREGQGHASARRCDSCCGDRGGLGLSLGAAALLGPLLVWGGYALLPFNAPAIHSAPLRLVYTLRCSFFAVIPIMLGVVVEGVARLRFGRVSPLYEGRGGREVALHRDYVSASLLLFLLYFLQLAVMATYLSQDLLKLVPLLTILFALGRLVYWVCVSLGSSVRALGFGLSFLPLLVMTGTNLYFVCSSLSEGVVFDTAPPTTAPPPRQRWWG